MVSMQEAVPYIMVLLECVDGLSLFNPVAQATILSVPGGDRWRYNTSTKAASQLAHEAMSLQWVYTGENSFGA